MEHSAEENQALLTGHQHHYGLTVCWKIRQGLRNGVDPARIKAYCDHFFSAYLQPHFREEELFLFPILGSQHVLVKKAKQQHHRLEKLFRATGDDLKAVTLIEEELEKHIRFEERQLLPEIRSAITPEQAAKLDEQFGHQHHDGQDAWPDEFWK